MFLDCLGRVYPSGVVDEEIPQCIFLCLRRLENNRIPIGSRYRFKWYGGDLALMGAPSGCREFAHAHHAVPVEYYVLGGQFSAIHWCLVMPVNALADVEDIGVRIGLFPALGQRPCYDRKRNVAALEVEYVPIDLPHSDAELLRNAGLGGTSEAAEPAVNIESRSAAAIGEGECPAVLRRGYHLAGGRVHHHFLLHRRGRLLFPGRACPEAGCGQDQARQYGEARSECYMSHECTSPRFREHVFQCRPLDCSRGVCAGLRRLWCRRFRRGRQIRVDPGAISRNGVGRVPWCGLHRHGHPHTRTGRSQAPADWRRDGGSPEACSHVRQRRGIEDGGWRAAVDGARGRGQPQIRVVPVVGVTVYACVIYATEAIGGVQRG